MTQTMSQFLLGYLPLVVFIGVATVIGMTGTSPVMTARRTVELAAQTSLMVAAAALHPRVLVSATTSSFNTSTFPSAAT